MSTVGGVGQRPNQVSQASADQVQALKSKLQTSTQDKPWSERFLQCLGKSKRFRVGLDTWRALPRGLYGLFLVPSPSSAGQNPPRFRVDSKLKREAGASLPRPGARAEGPAGLEGPAPGLRSSRAPPLQSDDCPSKQ